MKHAALIASLVLAVALGLASATEAQPPAGAPRVCAPTNSEKTSVAAIAADPKAWMGKCVSVDAIYSGERLNADLDAIYGVNGNSIGGYVDGRGDVGGAWTGTFTGRVADCEQAEEDLLTGLLRSPGISLHGRTLGCLEPKGPFLVFMTHAGMRPSGLKRRLPGEKGGDLSSDRTAGPGVEITDELAAVFEKDMRAGDLAGLTSLLEDAYQAEQLLAHNNTALAALRQGSQKELRVFSNRASSHDGASSEACWCLKADCSKLWPIDSRDADNQPTRPYACIRIDVIPFPGRKDAWRWRIDASDDVYGLDEP